MVGERMKPKKDQRKREKGHLRKQNGSFLGPLSQRKDQRKREKGHLRKQNGSFLGPLSQRIYSYDLCGKHFP